MKNEEENQRFIVGDNRGESFWSDMNGGNWQLFSWSSAQLHWSELHAQQTIDKLIENGMARQDQLNIYKVNLKIES